MPQTGGGRKEIFCLWLVYFNLCSGKISLSAQPTSHDG